MALRGSERSSAYGPALHTLALQLGLAVLTAAAATFALRLVWSVPLALVMPALSIVSFVAAGIVALFAYCSQADRHALGMTPWDIAGVLALIWVGTGMLSQPEHVVQLFGHIVMGP
jgi:hypothetical protein